MIPALSCFTFNCEVLNATFKHDPAPFLKRRCGTTQIACCGLGIRFIDQWKFLNFLQAEQHFGLLKGDGCDGRCANLCRKRRNNTTITDDTLLCYLWEFLCKKWKEKNLHFAHWLGTILIAYLQVDCKSGKGCPAVKWGMRTNRGVIRGGRKKYRYSILWYFVWCYCSDTGTLNISILYTNVFKKVFITILNFVIHWLVLLSVFFQRAG